ncbi:MAG: His/Gly/Thr/Pro-type tRNA ligase C-terminal domain-containing protein, partial [Panacagrimonas sp.]
LNPRKAEKFDHVAMPLTLASPERVKAQIGCGPGSLGPRGLAVPIIADHSAAQLADFVCGANVNDHHLKGANWERDCPVPESADLRKICEGDASPDGQGQIKFYRGIEGGHIFQLGRKYTQAMDFTVLDEQGKAVVPEMGCYGIGVSRLAAAVIEQRHDAAGMQWPDSIAPFRVLVCPIGTDKSERVKQAAEQLYEQLVATGIDALLDDRGLRPGPMFADADLVGIPHRVVIGEKGLGADQYEYKRRGAEKADMIPARIEALLERLSS